MPSYFKIGLSGLVAFSFAIVSLQSSAASADLAAARQLLDQARAEFQDVTIDLPWDSIYSSEDLENLKERYRSAQSSLNEAISQVKNGGTLGVKKARDLAAFSLAKFRRIGLLMPFHVLRFRELVMGAWLNAEDHLWAATRKLEDAPSVLPNGLWKYGDRVWTPLMGNQNFSNAEDGCKSLSFEGTSSWRLPTFEELGAAYVAMRGKNPAFGDLALKWENVWTSDLQDTAVVSLNFQTGLQELTGRLLLQQTVCVGFVAGNR